MLPVAVQILAEHRTHEEPMADSLVGKVAYITGGSRGVGASVARLLAARGATVVIGFGSHKAQAQAIVEEIHSAGGQAEIAGGDVRKAETARSAVEHMLATYGRLDILVASAGISRRDALHEISEQAYRDVYDANVLGTILAIQAAAPHMTRPGGRIITVSSRVAINPTPDSALYAGAKAAIIAMTEAFAKELGPQGITVNSVAPGLIATERMQAVVAARGADVAAQTPLRRIGNPDDVARVVAFLASDDSGWITGRTLRVDGGIV